MEIVFSKLRSWIRLRVGEVVGDDGKRFQMQMIWVFRIVAIIVVVMTAVNLVTGEHVSIAATLIFGGVCLICSAMMERRPQWNRWSVGVLLAAVTALFAYYIISGEPEGFSAVWICIVPPVALLLLGRRRGGLSCAVLFAMMVFLMWTPWGRSLLQYPYPEIFLLRLPLVYTAAFWVSWFLEYVREVTQKKLREAQRSFEHLYRHDALTGVMNRYGFNEHIERAVAARHPQGLALIIVDLDDFKKTNDHYGHPAGDAVLKGMAETIRTLVGDRGETSRWGGEEFAVLLHRAEGAQDVAEQVRAAVEALRIEYGGMTVPATVSVGLTVCASGGLINAERLLTLTDQSLYYAKMHGKNQVVSCEYTPPAC